VFAETDLAEAAVVRALSRAGWSVPGDVSLVCFDDILGAEYIAGGLTTVYPPAAEMAAEGVDMLMRGFQSELPSRMSLPPRQVVRRSAEARSGS
jgi:DNA-binding LacI/PurR family transcriptional regulator